MEGQSDPQLVPVKGGFSENGQRGTIDETLRKQTPSRVVTARPWGVWVRGSQGYLVFQTVCRGLGSQAR